MHQSTHALRARLANRYALRQRFMHGVSEGKVHKTMKLYGYKDGGLPAEEIAPMELAEITLVATPEELRKISVFLQAAANNIESMGPGFSHEHLADKQPGFELSPQFVVSGST